MASLAAFSAVVSTQQPSYTPPRLVHGDLPALAPLTVVAGGEVLIEATVDEFGTLIHPIVLRSTPPFSNLVLDAVTRWRFTPARQIMPDRKELSVEGTVLIAAVYRAPTLMNGPTLGDMPRDLAVASPNAPYAVSTAVPVYPPQAINASTVMFEVSLDDAGRVTGARAVASDPAFDAAAYDALVQWKFRGASLRGRPVPSTAFVIFSFSQPVLGPPILAPPNPPPKQK
jgi:TonB family protein